MKNLVLLTVLLVTSVCGQEIAITHVNVVDVRSGSILRNKTVLINEGRIRAITSKAPSKSSQSYDGRGKFLIPGLWDMHVHTAGISAEPQWAKQLLGVYLKNGVTSVRDMAGDLETLRSLRDEEKAGLVVPHLYFSGPFIDGSAQGFPHPADVIAVETPEEARQAVRRLADAKVDFIKVGSTLCRECFFATADEAAKLGLRVAGHVPESVDVEEAAAAGMKSMEHMFGFDFAVARDGEKLRTDYFSARQRKDTPSRIAKLNEARAAYDQKLALNLSKSLNEHGVWIVPTLSWTSLTSTSDQIDATQDLAAMPEELQKQWSPEDLKKQTSAGARRYYAAKLEDDFKLIRDLHAHGVKVLAGSDSLDPGVFPGSSLHAELELLTKAGLSNAEGLRSATLLPAEFFGLEKKTGTVEAGKQADLVLLDGNPLENISAIRGIRAVFLGGRVVYSH